MITQRQLSLLLMLSCIIINLTCTEKIPEGPERTEILKVRLFCENGRLDFAQENHWDNRFQLPPKEMTQDEFEYAAEWRVPFGIAIKNDFDEAMEGRKWIETKINLWSANQTDDWRAELSFADTTTTRNMVIPPGDSISLYTGDKLTWEQKDVLGKSIHQTDLYHPIWVTCAYYDSIVPGTKPAQIFPVRECDTLTLSPVDTVIAFEQPKTIFAQAEVKLFKDYRTVQSDTLTFRIHYYCPPDGFRQKFWCREGMVMNGDPPCNQSPPP